MWGIGDANPCSLDVTEIEGFDNLHHPEGILKESMDWAASVYRAGRTYYLVNGSTGGILSAVSALAKPGGAALVGRNCHKSVYHGIILNQMESVFVYPQFVDGYAIQCGLNPDEVERILSKYGNIQFIVVVSPTYEGIVSDIGRISHIAHAHRVPLIVDEAHGAHFPFNGAFPPSSLEQGADIVVQSLHKTLPSFTQTALLHVNAESSLVDLDRLEWYLQIYQSSSPSYLMMASIENCILAMEGEGRTCMDRFVGRIKEIRESLAGMECLSLMSQGRLLDAAGRTARELGIYGMDISRVVAVLPIAWVARGDCPFPGGVEMGRILRDEFHLEMEMCGYNYVTAITTLADTEEGLGRLRDALVELDRRLGAGKGHGRWPVGDGSAFPEVFGDERPAQAMSMGQALAMEKEWVPWEQCAGRVCAELAYLYPPGSPILAPGERVSGGLIGRLDACRRMGMSIQGLRDKEMRLLGVVKGIG